MSKITPDELLDLVDPKNATLLAKLGGSAGLCEKLTSNLEKGLSKEQVANQISFYGTNILPEVVSVTFLQFVWEALKDQTLIVLMVAAAVEIGIGIYKSVKGSAIELIDGIAILVAIVIVVLIGSISDYRKQAQFKSLTEFGKTLNTLNIIRDGQITNVTVEEIVVGDVVQVETGLVVPADGVLISCFSVTADESTMTGEPHGINKDLKNDPFLLSGTSVITGVGKMMVIATGANSLNGRSMLALEVEPEDTPLQMKLGRVADLIAKAAFCLAIFMVVLLTIVYFVANPGVSDGVKISSDLLALLILAVTIVVVAVPEGLPLAVTLSLAHATLQMLKDQNLVRHLSACETMGNATTICSDKTGTLTLNKMTVVEAVMMNEKFKDKNFTDVVDRINAKSKLSAEAIAFVTRALNVNSTADMVEIKGEKTMQGSKTEIALLQFTETLKFPFAKDRESTKVNNVIPFSSEFKRMGCIVNVPTSAEFKEAIQSKSDDYFFIKGAAEILLGLCTKIMMPDGTVVPLTPAIMEEYQGHIKAFAHEALRTISCAFRNGIEEEYSGFTLTGIFGILDPIRPEVPKAVADCQKANVVVRMVTGDSTETARAIARGCGILSADGLVMEGPEFRKLSEEDRLKILPHLQVLARSSPLDKQILVNGLKKLGETVAVTGGKSLCLMSRWNQ